MAAHATTVLNLFIFLRVSHLCKQSNLFIVFIQNLVIRRLKIVFDLFSLFVLYCRCVWRPISSLKYPAIWAKKIHRIDWTTIRHSATRHPIRRFRRRKSATKFNFQMCWPAPNTTFGCTTQMQRTTICWHGPCRLQQVKHNAIDLISGRSRLRLFNEQKRKLLEIPKTCSFNSGIFL